MIPHSRPTISPPDETAVLNVLRSGCLAQGAEVERFENGMAEFLGLGGAVAVSSGTAALHLCLLALDVGEGDEVVIPSYVCTSLLHAVRYTGARPVLADVVRETCQIDPEEVARVAGPRTRAVIVPHLFGAPAEIDRIVSLGFPVIEDCAQTLAASCKGRTAGNYGTLCVCSFYATKVFCTGEGGMVLSDDQRLLDRVRDLRCYDERADRSVRFNYKMTDMQGALGTSQLRSLPAFLRRRREIAETYSSAFRSLPLSLPSASAGCTHTYYRYVVQPARTGQGVGPANGNRDRSVTDTWMSRLLDLGVSCRRPIHTPLHRIEGGGPFPCSDFCWDRSVSLPIYPSLSDEEVNRVTDAVRRTVTQD